MRDLKDYTTYIPIENFDLIEKGTIPLHQTGKIYDHEISLIDNQLNLHYPNAIFEIQEGNLVYYRKLLDNEELFIEQLSTSVYAALLFQREIVPFHASSFSYKQKGIMLCANSEVGKSSIAYAFVKDGAQLLCDDISPVKVSLQNLMIQTNSASLKLWEDSLNFFNIPKNPNLKQTAKNNKFNLLLTENQNYLREINLQLIFILTINKENKFEHQGLSDAYKMQTLMEQLFRIRYLKAAIPQKKELFKKIGTIAQQTKIYNVFRPENATIDMTKKYLEQIINETLF